MNDYWLWMGLIIGGAGGIILALVLGAFWLADRADDLADYERQLSEGDQCPWPFKDHR